jgi:hypothetical protein
VASNNLNQLLGIQECFIVLTRHGEIAHSWADLNLTDWDVEEVFQDRIQNDGVLINIYYIVFLIIYWILYTYLCAEY